MPSHATTAAAANPSRRAAVSLSAWDSPGRLEHWAVVIDQEFVTATRELWARDRAPGGGGV